MNTNGIAKHYAQFTPEERFRLINAASDRGDEVERERLKDTGKRMLAAWSEGVSVLRDSRMYGLSPWKSSAAFEGISDPPKLKNPRTVIGRSELLSHRTKSK